jgi:cell division protein FtsB
MAGGRVRRAFPINQLLLLVMGFVILYLVADFGRQVVSSRQRQEELQQIEQSVQVAQQKTEQLDARLEYARSPQAAEEWAREQGWAKKDEVPVVILAPVAPESSDVGPAPKADGAIPGPREAWWNLFFREP